MIDQAYINDARDHSLLRYLDALVRMVNRRFPPCSANGTRIAHGYDSQDDLRRAAESRRAVVRFMNGAANA